MFSSLSRDMLNHELPSLSPVSIQSFNLRSGSLGNFSIFCYIKVTEVQTITFFQSSRIFLQIGNDKSKVFVKMTHVGGDS